MTAKESDVAQGVQPEAVVRVDEDGVGNLRRLLAERDSQLRSRAEELRQVEKALSSVQNELAVRTEYATAVGARLAAAQDETARLTLLTATLDEKCSALQADAGRFDRLRQMARRVPFYKALIRPVAAAVLRSRR